MSISFQVFKNSKGWSLSADNRIDLTNWQIEYLRDRIRCKPTPLDFIYMVFGTVLFLGLAIFILLAAINPELVTQSRKIQPELLPISVAMPTQQQLARSKYQREPLSQDELEKSTREFKDRVMKDMTPEEKERFEKRLQETAAKRTQKNTIRQERMDRILNILAIVGRVFAALGVLLFGYLGAFLCLPRALLFFKDKIEISVHQGHLVLSRPSLFRGLTKREIPLSNLGTIFARASRRGGGRYGHRYVVWTVQISSRDSDMFPLQFDVEHLDGGASLKKPSTRVKEFVTALKKLTGIQV